MQNLSAHFLVARDTLAQGSILLQVTTGPRGEILVLAVDRNWWIPDRAEPPYHYTVTSWQDDTIRTLHLDSTSLRLTLVQTLGPDAFLLVSPRMWETDNAMIVTADGSVQRRFTLSDGIKDVQVDRANRMWVCYFDEGVFSGFDLPAEGLVCLDSDLNPIVRFNTLALNRGLPLIWDCYTLNVASANDVYTYYYGESVEKYFPLVHLRAGNVAQVWEVTNVRGAGAVAIGRKHALFGGVYEHPERLTLVDLETGKAEEVQATDPDGRPILIVRDSVSPLASGRIWGRGSHLYLLDYRGVWVVALPN